jgi:hypothetical protein
MSFGKFLLFLIVAAGTTTAVLYWQQDKLPFKLPTPPSLSSVPQINQLTQNQQLNSAAQQAQQQLQVTGEKFQTVSGNAQQILGAAVQENEKETKTAPEKALDYGKYLYCKQVVTEFEKQQAKPIDSPAP